ncbi:pentapeptide repeat-containing protein [Oricola sp.]|uniref:pentapeptide repeat-containing protein n=1 Tax=Oricola sp. TaxID=1979950 RepID=UPI003BA981EA
MVRKLSEIALHRPAASLKPAVFFLKVPNVCSLLTVCFLILSVEIARSDPAELGLDPTICRPSTNPGRVTEYLPCSNPVGTRLSYDEILGRINSHLDWLEGRDYPDGLRGLNQGDRSRVLNLCNVDLTGGDFEAALRDSIRLPFNRPVLAGAYMPGAVLRGVDLRIVDLRASYLHCIDFREADLSSADLSMSNIDGSDFSGARLRDTHLNPSNMQGVDLHSTEFQPSSLMSPNFLNDFRGLREMHLDPNDLSEARLLIRHFDEAGHPSSASDVMFAVESAITRGLMDAGSSIFERARGLVRMVSLGFLLEYGLSTHRIYLTITALIIFATFFYSTAIWRQASGGKRQEIFIKLPAGEPIQNRYGKFELRQDDILEPIRSTGFRAIVDGFLLAIVSSLKVAIGPINLAASISDFRPLKLSYSLTGRSRVLAGLIAVAIPGLLGLSFYY